MSSKRYKSIAREGERLFCPEFEPSFIYNGKPLTSDMDRREWFKGWCKAKSYYDSVLDESLKDEDNEECIKVKCPCCGGRGGFGSSYGGVTLSYSRCNHCDASGYVYKVEDEYL